MRNRCCAPLLLLLLLSPLLLTPPEGDAAVITGACDKDPQCGGGMCCAVSIWVKSIRICTPMGKVGDSCHPLTRKNHFGNGRQERRNKKRRKRKTGSIFWAENASYVSMYAWLSLFTGFIQPICLFSPKVITLEILNVNSHVISVKSIFFVIVPKNSMPERNAITSSTFQVTFLALISFAEAYSTLFFAFIFYF